MAKDRFLGGDDIIIRNFMLVQTGGFFPVYNRPFQMELDDRSIENIRSRIYGTGRGRITDRSFAGISTSILSPVSDVSKDDLVEIPNDWGNPRLRFLLHLTVKTRLGQDSDYFFQGFSEYLGVSRGREKMKIDPKMEFYINGFIRVQYATRMTRTGREEFGVVKQAAQIINGRLVFEVDRPVTRTRTVDLYSTIQSSQIRENYSNGFDDDRYKLSSPNDSIFAHRDENLPGRYLSNALDAWRRSSSLTDFGVGHEDMLSRAQSELNSEIIQMEDNPFLRSLSSVRGSHLSTTFTLNDLIEIDSEILRPGIVNPIDLDSRAIAQLAHTEGDVSDWRGSDLESRWAVQISNMISAIMMTNYHYRLDIQLTNMNLDRRCVIEVYDAEAFAGKMPIEIHERMLDQLEDAFTDLSSDDSVDYHVRAIVNLYNQAELRISLYGEEHRRYFVPTFADALMSPFFTRDEKILDNLATDLQLLVSDVSGEISGSAFGVAKGV